jgi:hypothetical protein
MLRLIAIIFTFAVATSAQAMTFPPTHQPDSLLIQVRDACGAGMHRVNGRCVTTPARRQVRRVVRDCGAGMQVVNGRCVTMRAVPPRMR